VRWITTILRTTVEKHYFANNIVNYCVSVSRWRTGGCAWWNCFDKLANCSGQRRINLWFEMAASGIFFSKNWYKTVI